MTIKMSQECPATPPGDYREWVIYNNINSDFAIKNTDYTFYSEWVVYDNINSDFAI